MSKTRSKLTLGSALGDRIRESRLEQGMSQLAFSMALDCTQSAISDLEGHGIGTLTFIRKAFTVLGVATEVVGATLEVDWYDEALKPMPLKFTLPELSYD